jgi:hypothetical protein
MAKSCRQQVVEAVLGALAAIPMQEIEGGQYKAVTLEVNRRVAIDESEPPILILFEGGETPLNDFSSEDAYELTFAVQAAVNGSGAIAVTFANNLRAEVEKALFADRTLGGVGRFLELHDGGDWIGVEIDSARTEGFMLGFRVGYATREGDPFTFET